MSRLLVHRFGFTCFVLMSAGLAVNAKQAAHFGPAGLPILFKTRGMLLSAPVPDYPAVAKVNFITGRVQLELTVDDKGKVAKVHVLDGDAILAVAAVKAALRWIYRPLLTASGPSAFITRVRFDFSLTNMSFGLSPRQAEQDFMRQVKPPQVSPPPGEPYPHELVRLQLLVNDHGQVIDADVDPEGKIEAAAFAALKRWSFVPAHWGTLPIASYVDVGVPVNPQYIPVNPSPREVALPRVRVTGS